MKRILSFELTTKQLFALEILVILSFAIFPNFFNFPYRVNIFLSWEGAYRLYLDQIPYKDFGLPLGFTYWIIPATFFKLFGPSMMSLIKAQTFINIISGFAFRGILKVFRLNEGKILVLVILYCLSYSFFNFWPWYNQSVFVFELIGLYFLLLALIHLKGTKHILSLITAALFITSSFFTKQDGGGFAILIAGFITVVYTLYSRKFIPILVYSAGILFFGCLYILPFLPHDFGYWFNHGQPPHYSRLSMLDIFTEVFGASEWLKFYFIVIVALIIYQLNKNWKYYTDSIENLLFPVFTLLIIFQASIIQVTSYTPPDNNIYFHSIAIAFILGSVNFNFNLKQVGYVLVFVSMVFLWWSGTYWDYIIRIGQRKFPELFERSEEGVVSKNTYMIDEGEDQESAEANWVLSDYEAFKGIYIPKGTLEGIKRAEQLDVFKTGKAPSVLNMTELTPLAYEWGYELKSGYPLWYHLNVSMFDREAENMCKDISAMEYDLILFEDVPFLNNFFAYPVLDCIKEKYVLVDRFDPPRRPVAGDILVFIHPRFQNNFESENGQNNLQSQ